MLVSFMVGLSLVVAGVGAGLMSASPERPAQPMAEITSGTGKQPREQMLDLVAGQWGQPGRRRAGPFSTGSHHEDGVGEHGQGGPAVPGAPAADLMLVQTAKALAGLEALLSSGGLCSERGGGLAA
jgi:hypothetical protein